MKNLSIPFLLTSLLAFTMCQKSTTPTQGVVKNTGMPNCEGLSGLRFQNQQDSIVGSRVAKFATDVALAAKVDATKSKSVPASGNGTATAKAEIGKTVNEWLVQSSHVSEEFWQQDIVFRECICFLDGQSRRNDIPESEKVTIRQASIDLAKARSEYSLQFQKKNGQPQK